MKSCIRAVVLALGLVFLSAAPALAAKTFTVAPFVVQGPAAYGYLEQSIPQIFASRLYWQGNFEQASKPGTTKKITPDDEAAATQAMQAAGADYVIWGSVTIVGDNCSVDVRVRDAAGKTWPLSRESNVNRLIPDLRRLSDSISAEVFQRPQAQTATRSPARTVESAPQMNPDLIRNETTEEVYINPQIRYSGSNDDASRQRSQILNYASVGMEICDATGNGRQEVFILADHAVYAYRYESDAKLTPLGKFDLPSLQQGLSIRSIDYDYSGRSKIIVNAKNTDEEPIARILSFDGQKFTEIARAPSVYLNVVNLPPMYRPQLIGQRANPPHLFVPGISEASVQNGKVRLGGKITMPKDFNVFNFSFIPPDRSSSEPPKLIMIDGDEKLRLYTEKGNRMATSQEMYSGSAQGIYVDVSMPGLGKNPDELGTTYFVPMRLLPVDLDGDGKYEVIVNKPITTAGAIFHNYRSFPQSEIHSVQWDGLGISLVWKTRRIRGSVTDYAVTDINNDGGLSLVVCVNTHPGALGASARRTMVIAYPLDLSKADPGTRPHISE